MKLSIIRILCSILAVFLLTECTVNRTGTCRKRCEDLTNICFLTSTNNPNPAQNQATTCFLYSVSCTNNCGYYRSSSSSRRN